METAFGPGYAGAYPTCGNRHVTTITLRTRRVAHDRERMNVDAPSITLQEVWQ